METSLIDRAFKDYKKPYCFTTLESKKDKLKYESYFRNLNSSNFIENEFMDCLDYLSTEGFIFFIPLIIKKSLENQDSLLDDFVSKIEGFLFSETGEPYIETKALLNNERINAILSYLQYIRKTKIRELEKFGNSKKELISLENKIRSIV